MISQIKKRPGGKPGPLGDATFEMQHVPRDNSRAHPRMQAAMLAKCVTCSQEFQRDADWKRLCVRCWRQQREHSYDARPTSDVIVERMRSELEAIWPGLQDLANGYAPDHTTRLRAGTAMRRLAVLLDFFKSHA